MAFTNPKENIIALQLSDSMTVADLGSGTGNYSLIAAKEVSDGKVYAIEIQKDLLERLKNEASHQGISNIEIIWGDLEREGGSTLRDHSVDALIISNTLFQVEKKDVFIKEARRILRPAGRALVVDWSESFAGLGPQEENIIKEDEAQKLFKDNGFEIEKTLFDAGEHHYGFVARLENRSSNE
jgi:ubiquinone/menaquinone biosynthesis C-methylase UbiE